MKFATPYTIDYSRRNPRAAVDPLFHQRWSPRSLKKTAISDDTVAVIIDAARWSQSAFNEQPWLFMTSSGPEEFELYLNLLNEFNRSWAKNAGVLGFIFAKRRYQHNDKPNSFYFFDCGAAWMAMTLQARMFGLFTHGMGGIEQEETYSALNVPKADWEVVCGFTLSEIDVPELLPEDQRASEFPSPRKPLGEIWKNGRL